jgi:hypothetical protein
LPHSCGHRPRREQRADLSSACLLRASSILAATADARRDQAARTRRTHAAILQQSRLLRACRIRAAITRAGGNALIYHPHACCGLAAFLPPQPMPGETKPLGHALHMPLSCSNRACCELAAFMRPPRRGQRADLSSACLLRACCIRAATVTPDEPWPPAPAARMPLSGSNSACYELAAFLRPSPTPGPAR